MSDEYSIRERWRSHERLCSSKRPGMLLYNAPNAFIPQSLSTFRLPRSVSRYSELHFGRATRLSPSLSGPAMTSCRRRRMGEYTVHHSPRRFAPIKFSKLIRKPVLKQTNACSRDAIIHLKRRSNVRQMISQSGALLWCVVSKDHHGLTPSRSFCIHKGTRTQ